jgi:hypothetical protein
LPVGVFAQNNNGDVVFRPVPPPSKRDVQTLVKQIARGTEKLIAKRAQREFDDEGPALLAQEQAKSLSESSFGGGGKFKVTEHASRRPAFFFGYSLHAERIVNSEDRDGLEKLCRYASRAPIAKSRLFLADNGQVVVKLKRPLQDGRRELRFGQVELLQKLAILIPPPHKNLTRYFGVFAPAHRYRADVVAIGREPAALDQEITSKNESPMRKRGLPWAELLRRVFAIDILKCDQCGGDMKIIAIIPASEATEAILDHLGIDTHHNSATGPPPEVGAA